MMAWSMERTPNVARLMANTDTTPEDCTTAVNKAATRNASIGESPLPASMSRNQGSCAKGAAASFNRASPRIIMAPPRNDAATERYFDMLSLATTMPAIPRTNSETVLISKVTIRTRSVTPALPPRMSAKAPLMVTSPERKRLTTIKVNADMLWVAAPASAPQPKAASEFPVQRCAVRRNRRLVNFLRFSVRSHIPMAKRPSPPTTPPNSSIMAPPLHQRVCLKGFRSVSCHGPWPSGRFMGRGLPASMGLQSDQHLACIGNILAKRVCCEAYQLMGVGYSSPFLR